MKAGVNALAGAVTAQRCSRCRGNARRAQEAGRTSRGRCARTSPGRLHQECHPSESNNARPSRRSLCKSRPARWHRRHAWRRFRRRGSTVRWEQATSATGTSPLIESPFGPRQIASAAAAGMHCHRSSSTMSAEWTGNLPRSPHRLHTCLPKRHDLPHCPRHVRCGREQWRSRFLDEGKRRYNLHVSDWQPGKSTECRASEAMRVTNRSRTQTSTNIGRQSRGTGIRSEIAMPKRNKNSAPALKATTTTDR